MHEHLDGVGLIHMNARLYDPLVGRFLSPDPVLAYPDDPRDLNRYSYVWNNPLSMVDPSGASALDVIADDGLRGILVNDALALSALLRFDVEGWNRHIGESNRIADEMFNLEFFGQLLMDAVNPMDYVRDVKKLGAVAKSARAPHGNKIDDRPATLYEKYDKDGNFLKHGITKHEDPAKRYTATQIDGGTVVRTDRGPRSEMIKKERDLVERSPGPDNHERWAGKRLGE